VRSRLILAGSDGLIISDEMHLTGRILQKTSFSFVNFVPFVYERGYLYK